MLGRGPALFERSRSIKLCLVAFAPLAAACGGGGGGGSPGLNPTPIPSPPSREPPAQVATGGKSFGAGSEPGLALPMYGISLPFAAAVTPGSIFAGRRLDADGRYSISWKASASGFERADRFTWDGQGYVGSSGDEGMLDFGAIGSTPTVLDYTRVGVFVFSSPTEQAIAYFAGFETPVGSGPTAGTISYTGTTVALELRSGVEYALAGQVHLEADFQSNRMFGAIHNLKLFDGNGDPLGDYDHRFLLSGVNIANFSGSRTFSGGLIAQNVIDATATTNSTTLIAGRFFGPGAQEAGAVWQSDAIAGRQTWGTVAATTATVSSSPSFVQSVGTNFALAEIVTISKDPNGFTGTYCYLRPHCTDVTITPLASGGLDFSAPPLGTFGPPGSSMSPSLNTTSPYLAQTEATALTAQTIAATPADVFIAERGTLAYARFGYWVSVGTPGTSIPYVLTTYFATGAFTVPYTGPSQMRPTTGIGHYVGTTVGKIVDGNVAFDFVGMANFTANFDASTISGSAHSLQAAASGLPAPPIESITFGTAGFYGSQDFGGAASAIDGSAAVVGTGTWHGRFYGPGAAETAGVYSLDASGNSMQVWGSFGAGR